MKRPCDPRYATALAVSSPPKDTGIHADANRNLLSQVPVAVYDSTNLSALLGRTPAYSKYITIHSKMTMATHDDSNANIAIARRGSLNGFKELASQIDVAKTHMLPVAKKKLSLSLSNFASNGSVMA